MVTRIKCHTCSAESYGDITTELICMGCYRQLEADNAALRRALEKLSIQVMHVDNTGDYVLTRYCIRDIAREALASIDKANTLVMGEK